MASYTKLAKHNFSKLDKKYCKKYCKNRETLVTNTPRYYSKNVLTNANNL